MPLAVSDSDSKAWFSTLILCFCLVRFLALAAAVLSLGSPFKAAQCIHKLLDESSPNKQLLPTIQQVKDLLTVLERKIACAGFADALEVWDMILRSEDLGVQFLCIAPDIGETSGTQLGNNSMTQNELPNLERGDDSLHDDFDEQGLLGFLGHGKTCPQLSAELDHTATSRSSGAIAQTVSVDNLDMMPETAMTGTKIKSDLDRHDIREASSSTTVMETFSLPQLGLSHLFTGVWKASERSSLRETSKDFRPTARQRSSCPPVSAITAIIRAMSEMERLGEATFTTIQTPPSTAVWVIAFVRWCLGVEPYIRSLQGKSLILKQCRSNVLVEIGNAEGKGFVVRTFKSMGSIDKMLWECRLSLEYAKRNGWCGMAKIKTFFNTRLRNLQSLYRLYHIKDSLLLLAWKITDRIHDPSPWATRPFQSSQTLVMLVAKYFDVDNPFEKLRLLDRSGLEDTWLRLGYQRAELAAELYLEVLISSLIENVHLQDDPDVFVETLSVRSYCTIPTDLLRPVTEFLLGQLPASSTIALRHPDAEEALLSLLGLDYLPPGDSQALAKSARGQVAYLSVLETLTINSRCMYQWRVFPGQLEYEGETYAYISGVGTNRLEDFRKVSENPADNYSSTPFRAEQISKSYDLWMCSTEDNHLVVYWVPNPEQNPYLDIRSSLVGAERLVFLDKCGSTCMPLSDFSADLVYCKTVAAALFDPQPWSFRVLCLNPGAPERFLAQAIIGEEIHIQTENQANKILAICCGKACISCACKRAADFLEDSNPLFQDETRIIIIT